ncbi:MAG TPA: sodium:proton antiporter [Bryobacteraceae bacterium]|nr:sodium:proton antiporter [Bryobacteraceae bacterium]
MDLLLYRIVQLLAIAIFVAIIARRLHLSYTVGLVITGIALAVVRIKTGLVLSHDLIFDLILPPLLFEAALSIRWQELRRDALPVLTLATLGVVISALAVAAGMVTLLRWSIPSAAVFGILIAATDPVAIIAMFKDTGIKGRLRLLVESESLLNDGVAAVLFAVALAWAQAVSHEAATPEHIALALARTAGGGILTGIVLGGIAIAVAGRTSDHLVETALTTVAAWGSFLIAERLGASGVLATVSAGLLMGNLGVLNRPEGNRLSQHGREFVVAFWEFAAFIANSLIFLLIGLTVAGIPFSGLGTIALLIAIGLVLAGRALTVYPLCLVFFRSRWAIPIRDQHILWWGGLRGALALALALALPASLPFRDQIVTAAFGVVVFSVVIQGLTMPPLLRALAFLPKRS